MSLVRIKGSINLKHKSSVDGALGAVSFEIGPLYVAQSGLKPLVSTRK